MPARSNWNKNPNVETQMASSTITEKPADKTPPSSSTSLQRANGNDEYYEDVDPLFVESASNAPYQGMSTTPAALIPGYTNTTQSQHNPQPLSLDMDANHSLEDSGEGPRSPTNSEASNYTSISQRGVNPNWTEPNPLPTVRTPVQQRDIILNNPDFELPIGRGGQGARGGRLPVQASGIRSGERYPRNM